MLLDFSNTYMQLELEKNRMVKFDPVDMLNGSDEANEQT